MRTIAAQIRLFAQMGLFACTLVACAAGPTLDEDPAPVQITEDAGVRRDASLPRSDAGTSVDGGRDPGRSDAASDPTPDDAGDDSRELDAGLSVLGGLVIYQDGLSGRFAAHAPHDSATTAQKSGSDAAYLVVDPHYDGEEALDGASLQIELVTLDNTGSFGIPLAFWLDSVGHQPDVFEDVSVASSIRFSIKAVGGEGVLNVLAMSSTATSTSANIKVKDTWQQVTLSTTAGPDWVVYQTSSFQKFAVLQLNLLAGANPPNAFKGGTKIYLDNIHIE